MTGLKQSLDSITNQKPKGRAERANRRGARGVQTAPGLDRLACGFGCNKEQARGACKQRPGWTG
ncbi:MAG: hypothetical protein DU429_02925 [Candidatus Tokpelaia sp.]|nr:MAG: hypothetical protein DU430_05680 [Candidatus Tokpelaia sp.]KAA6207420.1 MAG: hypothetical protein DU429_02925 [Candidatus Tokpelaia sp.]